MSMDAQHDRRSVGEIVSDITTDLTALIRQELDLARTEIRQELSKAGKGAGLLGGSGLAAWLALLFVSWAVFFGLDRLMPNWLAAVLVAVVWAVVAAVMAASGRRTVQESNPALPQTQRSLKEDAQWINARKN